MFAVFINFAGVAQYSKAKACKQDFCTLQNGIKTSLCRVCQQEMISCLKKMRLTQQSQFKKITLSDYRSLKKHAWYVLFLVPDHSHPR
jgi:hypothetical protein